MKQNQNKSRFWRLSAFCLALWAVAPTLQAREIEGVVTTGGKPMHDVVVTDGLHFAYTDSRGRYTLDAPDDAHFVYLLTPKGFVCDYSTGIPQFYQRLKDTQKRYNFVLYPMRGDARKTLMIAGADTQLDTDRDRQRLFTETLPDMQKLLTDHTGRQQAMFIAGDLTWDVYGRNADVKQFVRQLGIPCYPVIGNHDYDKYVTPTDTTNYAAPYEADFGPTYYAFMLGDACYVVLNDIKYTGYKRYTNSLVQGHQMQWLRTLLGVVLQQNTNVFVVMHAPLMFPGSGRLTEGGDELKAMLLGKPFNAAVFSGHLHTNTTSCLSDGLWEYNMGAICGYFWETDVSGDGTPNGYHVIETDSTRWQQHYKATGMDMNCQMKLYAPGAIADRPNDLCCKIWNWDTRWQVSWSEDGKEMGAMRQMHSFDPDYLAWLDGRLATADYTPRRTNHFFSCHPSPSARRVTVKTQDAYGNIYTQTYSLKP